MQEVTSLINKNEIIKQIPLFSELNWFESWALLPKLSFFEYKKNEVVYQEGSPADAFYLLLSGRLQVCAKSASGQERTLEYLVRSRYFGILSLLTGESHSVSVKAINDSLVLKIPKNEFDEILKSIPRLAVHMSRSLSRRLRLKRLRPKEIFATKIISVLSAVGRVGKSMYAVNLAFSLKKETNKRVVLLDMSSGGGLTARKVGLHADLVSIHLADVSIQGADIKKNIVAHACGMDFIRIAPLGQGQGNITHLLSLLMRDYHYVVVDLAVQLDAVATEVLRQSDLVHVVTEDTKQSLGATRALAETLKKSIEEISENISIIINEIEPKKKRLAGARRKRLLGERVDVMIPPLVGVEDERGRFMAVLDHPDTEYARVVRSLSRRIGEVLVGLALSGGAAFGIAHVGVLKVLEEEGIAIDAVAGTSMGAFVGALWVSGLSAPEIAGMLSGFRSKLKVLGLFDLTFPQRGLVLGRNIIRLLKKNLKVRTFEELRMPFRVLACDLESRQEVIFDEGSLAKAVRASIAIPGIFTPLFDQGRFLMDGGVLQPLPIQPLIQMGVSKIIAVNVLPSQLDIEKSYQAYRQAQEKQEQALRSSSVFRRFGYYLKKRLRRMFFPNIFDAIVIARQASESVLAEVSSKQADVCLHPDPSGVSWFEFYRQEELIKRGEEEARKLLPQIKSALLSH